MVGTRNAGLSHGGITAGHVGAGTRIGTTSDVISQAGKFAGAGGPDGGGGDFGGGVYFAWDISSQVHSRRATRGDCVLSQDRLFGDLELRTPRECQAPGEDSTFQHCGGLLRADDSDAGILSLRSDRESFVIFDL